MDSTAAGTPPADLQKALAQSLLVSLCRPVCEVGKGVLVFCPTKADCALSAKALAAAGVARIDQLVAQDIAEKLEEAVREVRSMSAAPTLPHAA